MKRTVLHDDAFRALVIKGRRERRRDRTKRMATYLSLRGRSSPLLPSLFFTKVGQHISDRHDLHAGGAIGARSEMCYATLAMATDYDCWHTSHESVTADLVTQNLLKNVQKAKDTVAALVGMIPDTYKSPSASALRVPL